MPKQQTIEQRARVLDDTSKTIAEVARQITISLGSTEETIAHYIRAKRRGYESYFKEKMIKSGFPRAIDLYDEQAKKAGYERGWNQYNTICKTIRGESPGTNNNRTQKKQKEFESAMLTNQLLKRIPAPTMEELEELERIKNVLELIDPVHKEVLIKYYLDGDTCEEIAKRYGVTHQNIYENILPRAIHNLKRVLQGLPPEKRKRGKIVL